MKLFSRQYILVALTTTFYSCGVFYSTNNVFGINPKWFSVIIFTCILNFFGDKKSKNITNQLATILFLLFTFMESINLLEGISSHPGGVMTLFFLAIMSFTFYRLPIPVLQIILSFLYYSIIPLIILSVVKSIFGISILEVEGQGEDYIETNTLDEKSNRFVGVFANPNSLAIYSLFLGNWVFSRIFSLTQTGKKYSGFQLIIWLIIAAACIYCGILTGSLQFPSGILLVQITLRFFMISKKLSGKQVIIDAILSLFVGIIGWYFYNLSSTIPEERKIARTDSVYEAISQTDRWYLFGYGFGQNNTEINTIDIGPAKWLLELGMFSIFLLMIYIMYNFIKIYKLKRSYKYQVDVNQYYIIYASILVNWMAQNVIYSPLYLSTTIWLVMSIIIEKMEINHTFK